MSAEPTSITTGLRDRPGSATAAGSAQPHLPDAGRMASDAELVGRLIGGRDGPLASRLALHRFGGLAALAAASPHELDTLPGVGPRGRDRLVAAFELGRRAVAFWPDRSWRVGAPGDLAERLLPEMGHLDREELRVCLLTTKNAVISVITVYVGNVAGSSVRVGEVFRDAVRRQAPSIVVVHNHPSGDPTPSAEDLRLTRELAQAGRLLDVDLLDHLVIGHGRWVSLRALGALL
ncbi:MAG: hypothetical protein DLM71_10620 [Chloroflexi bacterium]|nr:MAG: hypothetical protein DLM71_10620 [Chloroflexota bacterium]